jgi:hypothetical protein
MDTRNLIYAYKSVGLLIGWVLGMMVVAPPNAVWSVRALNRVYAAAISMLCPSPNNSLQDTQRARQLFVVLRSLVSAATGLAVMVLLVEQLPAYLTAERSSSFERLHGANARLRMRADRSVEVLSCLSCMAAMFVVIVVRGRGLGRSDDNHRTNNSPATWDVAAGESTWLLRPNGVGGMGGKSNNIQPDTRSNAVENDDDQDSYLV